MNVAFLGTPEAACPSLVALVEAGHTVSIVITQPDRRRGRGSELSPSPVKKKAQELGLRVAHDLSSLGEDVDLGVVVAYGAMIPEVVLDRIPMLNVHFSLLPRWRGAAPVERAILAGDVETGVGIMGLEVTLDTGPLFTEVRTSLDDKYADELTQELANLGATALVSVLEDLPAIAPRAQVGEATYAKKLNAETFRLSPQQSAQEAARIVRLNRAYCSIGDRRFRVHRASVGLESCPAGAIAVSGDSVLMGFSSGALRLESVQIEGGKRSEANDWARGQRDLTSLRWH